MKKIRVKVEHAHALPIEEARERVLRLIDKIRGIYAHYGVTNEWTDEHRTAMRFRFAKEGRGHGVGTATLGDGRVTIDVDADFKLPFILPVSAAEWKVKDELGKALRDAFA